MHGERNTTKAFDSNSLADSPKRSVIPARGLAPAEAGPGIQ